VIRTLVVRGIPPSGPRRLPVARQHPDHEDGHARADEERSCRRAEAGAEQTRHCEHEDDSDDELDHPMDREGDHLDDAERKAREKCHQEMDDREPPSDGRHIATEPEKKWREKEYDYGDEIEKPMETRVQKIHELIIARPGGGVSANARLTGHVQSLACARHRTPAVSADERCEPGRTADRRLRPNPETSVSGYCSCIGAGTREEASP